MLLIGGATQSSATKYRKWIVLPCPRREAELIGEVAQRDGGVRCHCSDRLRMHQAPTPSRLRRTSPINYAALREQRKIIR